ncbi:FluC/FEX family fluoride channel [Pseudoclavibacter sp. VKM Ac-2867]|uniref:FluC/FEX family fluoride channel n=1 Tax=Pseudoclavibacter sp. VKM Ac-2867 TaxID=2783829 RepID=UPI00188B611D|nr:CrcB family protein [Pseudoclavibacter sp. VKM Ac-2867]MBF4457197.1 CrcB family protein [Pseudoclavibacter sp. VKM Ac-2867]
MDILMLLAVGLAGGLGACIRYVAVEGWPRMRQPASAIATAHPSLPHGTASPRRVAPEWRLMIVNVVASLIAGLAAGLLPLPTVASMLVISGFCGGMSSWSSVMLDATNALGARKIGKAAIIVTVQMLWGVLAALIGVTVGQVLGESLGLGMLGW